MFVLRESKIVLKQKLWFKTGDHVVIDLLIIYTYDWKRTVNNYG